MSYYAVAKGRNPGIYRTWDECKSQVHKFSGPVYKKFSSQEQAEEFIKAKSGSSLGDPKLTISKTVSTLTNSSSSAKISKKRTILISSDDGPSTSKRKCHNSVSSSKKGATDYVVDENGYTEVYTDGACSSNGRGDAKAGIGIWFYDNCPLNVSQPVVGRATNNMAEIQAVTIAARQASKAGIKKLKISTDSKFLIKCYTEWMPNWKNKGWLTAEGKPVINKAELIEMEKALKPLQVTFNHVRGHNGEYGNETADRLAREGSLRYKQQ